MQTVISASRRTDIPAFYLDWFIERLKLGSFVLGNPFNGAVRRVEAARSRVAAIVFWSKNFGSFLQKLRLLSDWPLVFNFTLNSPDPLLEPGLPLLEERLEQLRTLSVIFGPRAVRWRFDPVVFYESGGRAMNNLGSFERLLGQAAELGLESCTISFMDPYRKIARREKLLPDFRFRFPERAEMLDTAAWMAEQAGKAGIRLLTCCERELAGGGIKNLEAGGCIDHGLIESLYGVRLSGQPDPGQRKSAGCLCHESVDVGSYIEQPCLCGCLYCYANPLIKRRS